MLLGHIHIYKGCVYVLSKKLFIINTFLLTFTTIFLRLVGMFFRIYLSNKIGTEGMGLYQLILSVYMVFISFANAGISVSVTRLVSENMDKYHSHRIVSKTLLYQLCIGVVTAILLYAVSGMLCSIFLKDTRIVSALKVISLSLPFIAMSSCFKGFFIAKSKVIKTTTAQILEDIIKIAIIFLIIDMYIDKGLDKTCVAIAIGTALSEVASWGYLGVLYIFDKGKVVRSSKKPPSNIIGSMLRISLPLAGSAYITSTLKLFENMLIPSSLQSYGQSISTALSQYGMLKGMALPLILFPSALLTAFSTLLVPEITRAKSSGRNNLIRYTSDRVLKLTMIVSMVICGLFVVFSDKLGNIMYSNSKVGYIIKILAPLVPFIYLDGSINGILMGLDRQKSIFLYNTIDSVGRILLMYMLIPRYGFNGLIFVMYLSNILLPSAYLFKLASITGLKVRVVDYLIKPLISVVLSCAIGYAFITKVFFYSDLSFVTTGAVVICAVYVVLLYAFKCITTEDFSWVVKSVKRN